MRFQVCFLFLACCSLLFSQCSRTNCDCIPTTQDQRVLRYSDSVFYLKHSDYSILPLGGRPGTYTAFPDNLAIDKNTGAITITQNGKDGESQTGMWYKIRFRSMSGNETDSTFIMISGITYLDKFYNLGQGDSIIRPIYNGDPGKRIPFGNYNLTSDDKFAINPVNGEINIRECMRRGFFNSSQSNTAWKIATVRYSIDDQSGSIANKIDLVIYYYHTMNDVPGNVSALMQAHQQMTVGMRSLPVVPSTTGAYDNNLPGKLSFSKPRPPCVIIVGS